MVAFAVVTWLRQAKYDVALLAMFVGALVWFGQTQRNKDLRHIAFENCRASNHNSAALSYAIREAIKARRESHSPDAAAYERRFKIVLKTLVPRDCAKEVGK